MTPLFRYFKYIEKPKNRPQALLCLLVVDYQRFKYLFFYRPQTDLKPLNLLIINSLQGVTMRSVFKSVWFAISLFSSLGVIKPTLNTHRPTSTDLKPTSKKRLNK